ncbi:MAG TPA: UDP-N-acetylmuramoylalanyl-D-glutamyl-2, 6-diaminopimelate--D-alanyl-D-alanine ligase, partial [Limnochordia bacterium]
AALGLEQLVAVGEHAHLVAAGAAAAGLPAARMAVCDDGEAAAHAIAQWVRPGDVVLVKASRGMRLERVVAALLQAGERKEPPA